MTSVTDVVGSPVGDEDGDQVPLTGRIRGAIDQRGKPTTPAAIVGLLVAHVLLGVAMEASPAIGLMHQVLVLFVGVAIAFGNDLARVVKVAAYTSGCDVLWRQTEVPGPWEGGKYLLVAVLGIAIVRFLGRPGRLPYLLVVVGLLVPGAVITIGQLGPGLARDPLSFNLMGYVAIMASVGLMARVVTDAEGVESLIWAMLAPITAVAAVASNGTLGVSQELFESGASLSATSGGFGPNQVSTVIGAGALFGIWIALISENWIKRVVASILVIWFVAQSALTFSRGGLAAAVLALIAGAVFLLADPRFRRKAIYGAMGLGSATVWFIIPRLQSLTGGAFGDRFSSPDSTGRVDLSERDLETFAENPWFGAGVGLSKSNRVLPDGSAAAAHTEYTRLLADHGMAGVGVIVVLSLMAVSAVVSARPGMARAWSAAAVVWAMAAMGHTAMRVALIGFVFGLAFLRIELDQRSSGRPLGLKSEGDSST